VWSYVQRARALAYRGGAAIIAELPGRKLAEVGMASPEDSLAAAHPSRIELTFGCGGLCRRQLAHRPQGVAALRLEESS
jgi:hypothetical protein